MSHQEPLFRKCHSYTIVPTYWVCSYGNHLEYLPSGTKELHDGILITNFSYCLYNICDFCSNSSHISKENIIHVDCSTQ